MLQSSISQDRKKDTRDKIQLGGLIVKAGLRDMSKAVLLGWLVELAERLEGNPAEQARLEAKGKKGFENDGKQDAAADPAGGDDAGSGNRNAGN